MKQSGILSLCVAAVLLCFAQCQDTSEASPVTSATGDVISTEAAVISTEAVAVVTEAVTVSETSATTPSVVPTTAIVLETTTAPTAAAASTGATEAPTTEADTTTQPSTPAAASASPVSAGGTEAATSTVTAALAVDVTTQPSTELSDPTTTSASITTEATITTTTQPTTTPIPEVCGNQGSSVKWSLVLRNMNKCLEHVECAQNTTKCFENIECLNKLFATINVSYTLDDPCHPASHQEVIRDDASGKCDEDLPINKWIRFIDASHGCLEVPMLSANSCYKPGSCGSKYPYYVHGMIPPSGDQTGAGNICLSDRTDGGALQCCDANSKKPVDIKNCGNKYFIYQFKEKMNSDACGRVCTSARGSETDLFVMAKQGDQLGKSFDDLSHDEKENLVAILIEVKDKTTFEGKYKAGEFDQKLKDKIAEKLKEEPKRRKRQVAAADANQFEVTVVEGTPRYETRDSHLYAIYVVYVTDGKGNVVKKETVRKAIEDIARNDADMSDSGSSIAKLTQLPTEYLSVKPGAVQSEPAEGVKGRLWVAILVIVGITALIVFVCFIGLLVYRLNKKRHSGKMDVSQSHKRPLVEDDPYYTPMNGHDNLALETDGTADRNQNKKVDTTLDDERSVEPITDENAV